MNELNWKRQTLPSIAQAMAHPGQSGKGPGYWAMQFGQEFSEPTRKSPGLLFVDHIVVVGKDGMSNPEGEFIRLGPSLENGYSSLFLQMAKAVGEGMDWRVRPITPEGRPAEWPDVDDTRAVMYREDPENSDLMQKVKKLGDLVG